MARAESPGITARSTPERATDRPDRTTPSASSTGKQATNLIEQPRCWGIGLGRTGTSSFCEALRILGYTAVAHNPHFDQLRSLDGGADNGVTLHYKYLDYKFPGSKFVLTTRSLDDWLPSMAYITDKLPVLSRDEDIVIYRRMTLYESVTFDREKFTRAYIRHHADVRRYFADRPGDLLQISFVGGDSWEKLCPFLGLPIPNVPFPHLHQRHEEAPDRSEAPRDHLSQR